MDEMDKRFGKRIAFRALRTCEKITLTFGHRIFGELRVGQNAKNPHLRQVNYGFLRSQRTRISSKSASQMLKLFFHQP